MSRLTPLVLLAAVACTDGLADAREAEIANVLEQADEALLYARPELVAGKYVLMSEPVPGISFYRGTLPLYMHDWEQGKGGLVASAFELEVPLVPSIGDPHPENFGTLLAPDGTVSVEPDDFDTADRAPYLFDLRRFLAGMVLAAHFSNAGDEAANEAAIAAAGSIARAGAEGYAEAMKGYAAGQPPVRVVAPTGNAYLDHLLAKAAEGALNRDELSTDTVQQGNTRRLVRGVLDLDDPENVWGDLPDFAVAALQAAVDDYRTTLIDPAPPDYFTVLDAVREFGAGVASWPKLRAIILLRGPTGNVSDNVLVEIKEITDSGIAGLYPPGVYTADVQKRDIALSRAAWSRPDADPLWGASTWEGFPVQVRREAESNRGVKVDDLVGEYGTVPVLTSLAMQLGGILARIHASILEDQPSAAPVVWARISADVDGFEDEQAAVGLAYAAQSLSDFPRFQSALQSLGTTLGLPPDPGDAPPSDLAALLGVPPVPPAPTPPSP
jgi:Uncharacterized protein conserved in bacteria (DUF2252)